ncbi:hypothetical protein ABW21_db0207053 [Orbilia brochopaga]|nr:hypothetical protein ABW21_db0207053 [Drechslerella brochopaga]
MTKIWEFVVYCMGKGSNSRIDWVRRNGSGTDRARLSEVRACLTQSEIDEPAIYSSGAKAWLPRVGDVRTPEVVQPPEFRKSYVKVPEQNTHRGTGPRTMDLKSDLASDVSHYNETS